MKKYSAILALTATSGLLQVGHGAASSLMVQQGGRLEFSETTLGLLVTATYVGFLGSNLILYRLLPRVSYIRTFAVCAAVMTSLALLMPLLPTEAGWIALRLAHGAFFCAAIIVCDGWLNTNATNQDRNKLVGVFTAVNYLAYGAGQYILVLGNRDSDHAFMLSALFIAMCLVPMCLTRFAEPQPPPRDRSAGLSWRDAYAIAPVAFLGQFAFGVYSGSSWLFIRYLDYLEIPAEKQGSLAAVFFGCGFILQIPVGWMADKMRDRRDMIIIVASASSACALMLGLCRGAALLGADVPVGAAGLHFRHLVCIEHRLRAGFCGALQVAALFRNFIALLRGGRLDWPADSWFFDERNFAEHAVCFLRDGFGRRGADDGDQSFDAALSSGAQ